MNEQPPAQADFNALVDDLIIRYGAESFCAVDGQLPAYTLFVDGEEIIAVSKESPRHPYGVYCQISAGLSSREIHDYLNQWLQSGEAYDQFLAMNVCRYNC